MTSIYATNFSHLCNGGWLAERLSISLPKLPIIVVTEAIRDTLGVQQKGVTPPSGYSNDFGFQWDEGGDEHDFSKVAELGAGVSAPSVDFSLLGDGQTVMGSQRYSRKPLLRYFIDSGAIYAGVPQSTVFVGAPKVQLVAFLRHSHRNIIVVYCDASGWRSSFQQLLKRLFHILAVTLEHCCYILRQFLVSFQLGKHGQFFFGYKLADFPN